MKAILLIELDDEWLNRINITCDEMFADVVLYQKESLENQCDYSQRIYRCWCPLKPMPVKKVPMFNPNDCDIEEEKQIVHEIYGYNVCIDEIYESDEE